MRAFILMIALTACHDSVVWPSEDAAVVDAGVADRAVAVEDLRSPLDFAVNWDAWIANIALCEASGGLCANQFYDVDCDLRPDAAAVPLVGCEPPDVKGNSTYCCRASACYLAGGRCELLEDGGCSPGKHAISTACSSFSEAHCCR